jgi:hypothetical protein
MLNDSQLIGVTTLAYRHLLMGDKIALPFLDLYNFDCNISSTRAILNTSRSYFIEEF